MPPPRRDLVGRTLGDFVVVARLDEGGHGIVYRAEQPALGRAAVIKVMQTQRKGQGNAHEQAVQRFLREARLASRVDHPYAAHVYAFGAEPDGLLWIAMELVRGTPLDRVLAESGALPLERMVPFFERLCEVVHTAHEQGIIHRDLKPANVMVVARAGRLLPKLLDLGIAKMTDAAIAPAPDLTSTGEHLLSDSVDLTREGAVVGSPPYMAPEQWTSPGTADARTDVYALGVLAYEALTRRRPFNGTSVPAIARAHAHDPMPPLGDGLPAALDDALGRALAKRQEERPGSALELAIAVRAASGLEAEREALPRLDDETRTAVLADAPRPIADAVAALESARHGHQLRELVHEVTQVLCHWLGVLTLACRSRLARRPESDLVVALTRRALKDAEWLALARALCRPYADERDLFPIPELVGFVLEASEELEALATAERTGSASEDQLRPLLEGQLAALGRTLRALAWLADYPLAGFMGTTRRAATPAEPLLADRRGRPLLKLAPLVQAHPPSPGASPELFLFAGRGRRGARFVAPPRGFERTDDQFWPWYREHLFAAPDEESRTADERSPYLGLAAFTADDAPAFVGREAETEAFLNRLRVTAILAVVGPSGAGKSSFVHAGVVPGLDPGARVVTLRPGAVPPTTLPDADVLVVDQAEELFTLCLDPAARLAFAERLVAWADGGRRVILTLRDDFLIRATELPPLREPLAVGLELLGTPARDQLLRILTLPAERAGYRFEEADLPARMVDDVAGRPGALALLSFTASRLWGERDRHFKQLTRQAYEALGGVGGALAQHAESVRARLPAEGQRLLRDAFRALVTAEGTRAVLPRRELLEVLGGSAHAERTVDHLIAERLLQTIDAERGPTVEIIHETLLTAWPRLVDWRREDAEGARLRDQLRAAARQWDERGRARGLLWRDDALAEHQRWRARYPGQLSAVEAAFGDASTAEARRARRNRRLLLGAIVAGLSVALAVALVLRSQAVRAGDSAARAQARSEGDLTRLLEDQGRRLLLDDDVLQAYPYLEAAWDRGTRTPALAYLLGRAARMLDQQVAVLAHEGGMVWDVQFTADGAHVLSGGEDRTVRVWDRRGQPVRVFAGHRAAVLAIAAGPDGRSVVSSDLGGRVLHRDLATGEVIAELPPLGGIALLFAPDGKTIVAGSLTGGIVVWDAVDRAPRAWLLGHTAQIRALRLVDGGRALVSAGLDGRVQRWDLASGRLTQTLVASGPPIWGLSTPLDGRWLAWIDADGLVTRLDLESGTRHLLRGQSPRSVLLALDGGGVVTLGYDGTLLSWDTSTPPKVESLVAHESSLFHIGIAPDGRRFVTTSTDGTAVVWDLARRRPIVRLRGHTSTVRRAVFDPRGELLVTAGVDGTARLFSPHPIDLVAEGTTGMGTLLDAMRASPDRRWLATSSSRGQITLVDASTLEARATATLGASSAPLAWSPDSQRLLVVTPNQLSLLTVPSLTPERAWTDLGPVATAAFLDDNTVLLGRPDGKLARLPTAGGPPEAFGDVQALVTTIEPLGDAGIAIGTRTGLLARYRRDGTRLPGAHVGSLIQQVAWDPRRAQLLVAATDATLHTATLAGAPGITFSGHVGPLRGVTVTAGGDLYATAAQDGTVRIWEPGSGLSLASLPGAGGTVVGVADLPALARIVAASTSGTASTWRVEIPSDFSEHREKLRCQVPYHLAGDRLVPGAPPACQGMRPQD